MKTNRHAIEPKVSPILCSFIVGAALLFGTASVGAEDRRNLTNVERENDQRLIWDRVNIGGNPQSVNGRELERGTQGVDGASLRDSWERMNESADFTDLRNRVDEHEIRITDLEGRVDNLEDQPGNWQPDAPEPGPSQPIGPSAASDWTPAISTQLADFTQSRTVTQDTQRTVNVYETNTVTGERRLIDTYTETDTETTSETRLVDVANNPGGGTDGWSAWMNIGGVYGCTGYSPATSTVDQGQRFTQTRTCSQNQERFVYYLPEGDATTERRGTRVASVTQSRSATGTRVTVECDLRQTPSGGPGERLIIDNRSFSTVKVEWDTLEQFENRFTLPTRSDPIIGNDGYNYWIGTRTGTFAGYYEACRQRR